MQFKGTGIRQISSRSPQVVRPRQHRALCRRRHGSLLAPGPTRMTRGLSRTDRWTRSPPGPDLSAPLGPMRITRRARRRTPSCPPYGDRPPRPLQD